MRFLTKYEQAIANCTEAIRLDPDNMGAYYNRGRTYHKLEKHEQAIADYTEAIEINPDYAAAYNNRGISYRNVGNKVKAIEDFRKAANLFKQQGDTKNYQYILSWIEKLQ